MKKITLLMLCIGSAVYGQKALPNLVRTVKHSIVMIVTFDSNDIVLAQGTGFFVTDRLVVSNSHVVTNAKKCVLKLSDGEIVPVIRIAANDSKKDIAILEVRTQPQRQAVLSTKLPEVGEQIIVLGNPLGLDQTVSEGIVSAMRETQSMGEVIQITAPVSHGSSGSPVINLNGAVIGIATYIVSKGQNLNFAVPIARAVNMMKDAGISIDDLSFGFSTNTPRRERSVGFWDTAFGDVPSGIEPEYEDKLSYGLEYMSSKKNREAVQVFTEAISINPEDHRAYYYRAVIFEYWREFDKALDDINKAIVLYGDAGPVGAVNHLLKGQIFAAQFNPRKDAKIAIEEFTKAIEQDSTCWDCFKERGEVYHQVGRHQNALGDFKKALLLCPKEKRGYVFYGRYSVFLEIGDTNNAIRDLDSAVAFFTNNVRMTLVGDYLIPVLQSRASIYHSQKKYSKAVQDYSRILHMTETDRSTDESTRETNSYITDSRLGHVYSDWGKPDSAILYLSYEIRSRKDTPHEFTFWTRGENYLKLKDTLRALADFDLAISLDSSMMCKYKRQQRGEILLSLGRYDEAIADFEIAGLTPIKMMEIYERAGRDSMVVDYCSQLLEDQKANWVLMLKRGVASSKMGRCIGALSDLYSATELASKEITANKGKPKTQEWINTLLSTETKRIHEACIAQ